MSRPTCATWPCGWRPCPTTEGCQGIDSAAVPLRMTAPLLIIAAAQFLLARLHTGIALRQPTSCCRPGAKHLTSPANSFGTGARSLSDMLRLSDHHPSHGETI